MLGGNLIRAVVLLVGSCVFFYFFPLFHVRDLGSGESPESDTMASSQDVEKVTDAAAYVDAFWKGELRQGVDVIDIADFWKAFDNDAAKAKEEFGREVGLGGATYFCVQGQGTIESVSKNHCSLVIVGEKRRAKLQLGVIADNTIREAIGVNVNEFANSRDFNSVSSALNERIETDVIDPIRTQLQQDVAIRFVGCAKVGGNTDLDPLLLVPIRIDVEAE